MDKFKILVAIICPWWIIYRQNRFIEKQKGLIQALSDILTDPSLLNRASFTQAQELLIRTISDRIDLAIEKEIAQRRNNNLPPSQP